MKLPKGGLTVALFALPSAGHAADAPGGPLQQAIGASSKWKISGSFRPRFEAIDGQFRPTAAKSDAMVSLQTSVFAEYDTGPVRFGAELMDSRVYFEKRRSSASANEVNTFEPIQAYVGLDFGKSSLTLGRFTQNVGSRRLVSRQLFRNNTNAYTGARFDRTGAAGERLVIFWSMPHTRLPSDIDSLRDNEVELDRESTKLQFFGASLTLGDVLGGSLETYAYGLKESDSPAFQTRNRRLFTPGIRLSRPPKAGRVDFDLEGIYQSGTVRGSASAADLTDLSVSAYFFHVELGRTFDMPWKPRVAVQYDRASGDGRNPRTFGRFDTLYGARRFEYGPTSLYGAIGRANLSSPSLRFEASPTKRLEGFVAYRPLWLESAFDSFSSTEIRDRAGRSGKFAGNQIEGRIRYWLLPKVARLDTGFALLAKGRFLRDAPNVQTTADTRYAYSDITFTF